MKTTPLEELLNRLPLEHRLEVEKEAEIMILDYRLQQILEELQHIEIEIGIKQRTLSAIENRGADIKLTTLKRYVETMGGKLRLDIELPTGKHIGFVV